VEADHLLAQRERSGFRQFFGADMHGPPTPEEEQLRRKAAVVMDTKNWILDESGNLHSVAGLAAKGLSRPRYTGPTMRAMTPDDKEAFERNEQRRKDLEKDEAWRSTFQKTLLNANPTFPANWNLLERVRLRQEAEDADRLLSMSLGERLGIQTLEWLIWELAIGGAGQFVGAARLGGGVPNPERVLNFLKENPAAVEKVLVRNLESELGRSIRAGERAQVNAAWKSLLPKVKEDLRAAARESILDRSGTASLPRRMSVQEALQNGLVERDAQWPWRGQHETEGHHPLMQGPKYRKFWSDRGLSNQDVETFVTNIDKDIHRAISEAAPGKQPWWDHHLLDRIAEREVGLRRKLTKVGGFIAKGTLSPDHGKTKLFPSREMSSHTEWWCFSGIDRTRGFQVI
jgi:hypothetical protein